MDRQVFVDRDAELRCLRNLVRTRNKSSYINQLANILKIVSIIGDVD